MRAAKFGLVMIDGDDDFKNIAITSTLIVNTLEVLYHV